MRTERTIKISALNIAMHQPHSPQRYVSLFREVRKANYFVPLGSLHMAMLGSLEMKRKDGDVDHVVGEIYRFVKLDPSEPWFNLETKEEATVGDVQTIKIPDHLLPHLQRIEFVFLPASHQLWFVSEDRKDRLGVASAQKFFQILFDKVAPTLGFPPIEVTVIPDKETLKNMLALHRLDKIVIELKRPNADDAAREELRWLARLNAQDVRVQRVELVALKGKSIKPDLETHNLAEVASKNGVVTVHGKDESGRTVVESTEKRPMVLTETVESDLETSLDVLLRVAQKL